MLLYMLYVSAPKDSVRVRQYNFPEASVLRFIRGACETVLGPFYTGRYAYNQEKNFGMPRKTGSALALLFG